MAQGAAYPDARSQDELRSGTGDGTTDGQLICELSLMMDLASEIASGSFSGAGTVEDSGLVTCHFTVIDTRFEGVLALEGRSGGIKLSSGWTARFSSALSADVEGDVAIVDGDGTYTGISGAGRLIGSLTYDALRHGFALEATCRVQM